MIDHNGRAGILARILRRPCPACERHKWYRDPYVKARPSCPESWHRRQYGRWSRQAPRGHKCSVTGSANLDSAS